MKRSVTYPAEMKAKAEALGAVLVTCDFFGKYAQQGSATMQCPMTVEEAKELERICSEFIFKRTKK